VVEVTGLIEFLRARLDEDAAKVAAMQREQVRVKTAPIFQGMPLGWLDGVDIFVSPDRWRAEVDAKRRILEYAEQAIAGAAVDDHDPQRTAPAAEYELYVLPALALPYADHPDYREAWRP
jgi:hypothetical protein